MMGTDREGSIQIVWCDPGNGLDLEKTRQRCAGILTAWGSPRCRKKQGQGYEEKKSLEVSEILYAPVESVHNAP